MKRSPRKEQKMADRNSLAVGIGQARQEARNMGSYLYVRYRRLYIYGGSLLAANTLGVVYLIGHVLGVW
jgi:hypothetical protein